MSGMIDKVGDDAFVLGANDELTVTIKVRGVVQDISSWTVHLLFCPKTPGAASFEKISGTDTDWIQIDDATNGLITILIAKVPTSINTAGETYEVGAAIESGSTRERFGSATWEFVLPPEGAWS